MAATEVTLRVWRGDAKGGEFKDYQTEVSEGMVVLDAIHQIQAEQANDLASLDVNIDPIDDGAATVNFDQLACGQNIRRHGCFRADRRRCSGRANHGFGDGDPGFSAVGSWRISVRLGPWVLRCPS